MPRCADTACVRWRPVFGVWGGVRLNGTWFCSRSCAATAVRRGLESPPPVGESAGSLPPLRIGALLRHQGAITQAQLDEAVASHRKSGLRLGAALQAMARLTGWTAEPYLVDDAVWERALEGYAPDAGAEHQSEVVHDVDAASAHVVAAAVGRDAVVRYAGCGDFVWVRVEGGARTQDVLIQEERPCQAAPTAH